jgi:anti-anti-sigma regulatory factor
MAQAEHPEDRLAVAIQGPNAYVCVNGRGTFKISSALKQFGLAAIEKGCTRLLMDMERCVGMDSTFMGVLAGLAFHLTQQCGGKIVLLNLSQKTRGLLVTLGLDQIILAYLAGAAPEELKEAAALCGRLQALPAGSADVRATAETMLEAHENLVQLTPENYPKFKDVLVFLREDLKKESGEAPAP